MIDLIKKTVLAGIGATVVTKDKIEAAMQDLVKQGKVSADEARTVATRIAEDGRKEWEATSRNLTDRVHDLLTKADYARRSEITALEQRLKSLEEKIEAHTKVAP